MLEKIFLVISESIALIGVFIVSYSAFKSVVLYCWGSTGTCVRLNLGEGIILGLEFMVAADIIQSIAKPNYYDLGLLAALICIRTFLSYFLTKELESLAPGEKASLQKNLSK